MGKELVIRCPHCSSRKIVKNGHHHQGKLQFFCHNCHKYFYEDPAKGYPPTSIPYPIIAYLLYFHKKIPAFSDMRNFKSFVNQWLQCIGIRDKDVERHTIRYWIRTYEPDLENIINFQEAQDYVHSLLSENLKDVSKEEIKARIHPYRQTLQKLEESLGRRFCVELAHRDPLFFKELTEIISKQQVYCKRPITEETQHLRRPNRGLFFAGVVQ